MGKKKHNSSQGTEGETLYKGQRHSRKGGACQMTFRSPALLTTDLTQMPKETKGCLPHVASSAGQSCNEKEARGTYL